MKISILFQSPDGEIGNAVRYRFPAYDRYEPRPFQSPDGEIGNAVLSLGFRMEYRMRWAFFQT